MPETATPGNFLPRKMLFVLTSLAALFLTPAASQQMVTVGFYGESLCPDCIAFIRGPLTAAFKEVCWCSLIRIVKPSDMQSVSNCQFFLDIIGHLSRESRTDTHIPLPRCCSINLYVISHTYSMPWLIWLDSLGASKRLTKGEVVYSALISTVDCDCI